MADASTDVDGRHPPVCTIRRHGEYFRLGLHLNFP